MEIGVFGSPGSMMFDIGILFGAIGLIVLCISIIVAFCSDTKDSNLSAGLIGIFALIFLAASMTLLPIGHGKQNVGDCWDRLPATTLAVDGAFALNEDILYVVVRGKNDAGNIIRECAYITMANVKDYPGRPVAPGEYWVVVKDHEASGATWTTNTFVPVEAK